MNKLLDFWGDKATKDTVYEYLINYLKEEGLRKLFEKEDVSAVAEAKEMIDGAFENLDVLFEKKKQPKEQINHSR